MLFLSYYSYDDFHQLECHSNANQRYAVDVVLFSGEVGDDTAYGQYKENIIQDSACTIFPIARTVALCPDSFYLFFQTQFFLCHDKFAYSTTNWRFCTLVSCCFDFSSLTFSWRETGIWAHKLRVPSICLLLS